MVWPDLTSILSPIRWAVVGAVATRLYMPERMTQDLDIVIQTADGSQARQKLAAAGFCLPRGVEHWRLIMDGTQRRIDNILRRR